MRRISASLIIAATLGAAAAPLALAQMTPQTQGDVTYVSGGVGDEWQQSMEALRAQYNLHLLFAQQGSGAYFAYVPVKIADASGRTVLDATSQGPFLYARLKPGSYTVTALHLGQPITRTAEVPASGGVDLNFYWVGGTNY
jgi:hypothetical protein